MPSKTCQICEKPSGIYPLCKLHLEMKSHGLVVKNEKTNKWELKKDQNDTYSQKEVDNESPKNSVITIDENNKSKCIICGRQSNGLLFCSSCFHKYKNKELLFKITNCSSVELLDESYEGRYTCRDGHVVKSKSEREIDNFLFEKGIPHAYEKELPYGAKENETLHPDFYLPNYLGKDKHVYIEHWGYEENNLHYMQTKKFKMPKYKELGITLICTYEKSDTKNIEATLERKLNKNFIKENAINFEE